MWKSEFGQNYYWTSFSHTVPPFAARISRVVVDRGTWRLKWERLKAGGKQWQTTPKNLLRMQCARAIPVTWLGSGSCQAWPSRLNNNEWMLYCCQVKCLTPFVLGLSLRKDANIFILMILHDLYMLLVQFYNKITHILNLDSHMQFTGTVCPIVSSHVVNDVLEALHSQNTGIYHQFPADWQHVIIIPARTSRRNDSYHFLAHLLFDRV